MNPNKFLNADIATTLKALNQAKEVHKEVVQQTQYVCSHDVIVYDEYKPMEYLRSLTALRMCLACRLEEHADSVWKNGSKSWSESSLNPTDDRLFVKLSREEIYALRLPGSQIIDFSDRKDN